MRDCGKNIRPSEQLKEEHTLSNFLENVYVYGTGDVENGMKMKNAYTSSSLKEEEMEFVFQVYGFELKWLNL